MLATERRQAKPNGKAVRTVHHFIPWKGGKRVLLKEVLKRFPKHDKYVEGFFGGGAAFWNKEASRLEVLNDLDGRIVTLLRVAQRHPEALVEELHYLVYSRQLFQEHVSVSFRLISSNKVVRDRVKMNPRRGIQLWFRYELISTRTLTV